MREQIKQLLKNSVYRAIGETANGLGAVNGDERSLRVATFDALRRLTAHDFGRDEDAWRAWWTNHRKEIVGNDDPLNCRCLRIEYRSKS